MIVAIDGPAGSGKSTTARLVAERLGYVYLDTGAMYRALGLGLRQRGALGSHQQAIRVLPELRVEVRYDSGLQRVLLNGEDVSGEIRTADAGEAASSVSAWPEVREKLVAEQRRMALEAVKDGRGVVLDGRDIGTVVFPEAEVKIFMEADPEIRARRRYDELQQAGHDVSPEAVLAEINRRDRQDQTRSVAPLRKAADAISLDTSTVSIEEQVAFVIAKVRERGLRATGRP